jgi:hypothetical protein
MPILPTLESSQSVFSTGTLAPQVINSSPSDFGAATAQAGQQLGNTAMGVGGDLTDMAIRQKAINDETSVNDQYYKQAFPAITAATQNYLQQQGKDAVDGFPAYQDQLEQIRQQQRDQLANPQQQRMFDDLSRRTIAFNVDGAARHATQQNQVYQDKTSEGMVTAAGALAVQHYNDPIGFNVGLQSGINEIMTHSQFRGQPVEYAAQQVRQFTSNTYTSRLTEMANTDPVGAYDLFKNGESYVDQNGQHHVDIQSQIDPAQLPSLEGHLLAGAKNQYASVLSHGAIYGGAVPNPATLYPAIDGTPPLTNAVLSLESNGKDVGPDGKLLTSPVGAQGSMQVMPTTQTNPGYGVTPAKDNSPAELARVGRDYLGAMTAKYQDPALTLAAYNAGPGMVDDWLAGTNKTGKNPNLVQLPDPRTGAISSADFAAKIPFSETRAYVGKGLSMTQQPGDKPTALPTTAELKTNLPDIAGTARDNALRMYPNDPAFADQVYNRTLNQGNTVLQGVTAQQNAARDTLTRMMVGSKPDGSDRVTSLDQLLSTPDGKQAWSQATPEVQLAMQQTLSNPAAVPMTKQGFDTYYQLKGQAVNDPNTFRQQDLSQLYGKVPLAQILDLTSTQAALGKQDSTQTDKSINWSRTKADVSDMLKPLGLGDSAKAGTDQSKLTETFYGKLQDAAENYHAENKKYPDTTTVRKMAASLLTQGTQSSGHWYSMDSTIPAFQSPDLSKFTASVPPDQKPALQAQFQNVYHRPPTDDELNSLYTKFQLSKKGGK